jgi:hypothetical protein
MAHDPSIASIYNVSRCSSVGASPGLYFPTHSIAVEKASLQAPKHEPRRQGCRSAAKKFGQTNEIHPETGTYSNKNRETFAEKRAITMRD